MKDTKEGFLDLIQNEYFVQWIICPSSESNHFWENWLKVHPARTNDVEMARQFISSVEYKYEDEMSAEDYSHVLERIVDYSQHRKSNPIFLSREFYRVASAVAAVLVLMIGLYLFFTPEMEQEPYAHVQQRIVKQTQKGQKLKVTLPDGSKVSLNSESSITYSLPFVDTRKVTLSGEAFFDVARDESHPFTIVSDKWTTTVLGTSFNVRAYPDEPVGKVSVVSGKVQIDGQGNQALLVANMEGVFHLDEKQLMVASFDPSSELGWKEGKLIFREVPFDSVVKELERWYGVDLQVDPEMSYPGGYTGSYDNASLEEVLDGLSFTLGIGYKLEGKKVRLYKN